jgi:hypothetical protein
MIVRVIVPAVVGALLLATPSLAAGTGNDKPAAMPQKTAKVKTTSAQRCVALEKQFDASIKKHEQAAKANEAKTMRADGGKLCDDGQHASGVAKLRTALKNIGVKPNS